MKKKKTKQRRQKLREIKTASLMSPQLIKSKYISIPRKVLSNVCATNCLTLAKIKSCPQICYGRTATQDLIISQVPLV